MKSLHTIILFLAITFQANSQVTWEKLFSARSTDVFRSVIEVPAGGYICAGYSADSTSNDSDAYAVRLTTAGDTIWTYKYNGPSSRKDIFYKVINTFDGGFVFCGYTTGNAGSDDLLILKLNSSGTFVWKQSWGGTQRERGQEIIQTSDNNFVVVGYTTSSPATYYDAFMLRISSTGSILWNKLYGGGAGSYDDFNTVKQLSTGEYICGGQSTNVGANLDRYLVKTDSSGNALWQKRSGDTAKPDNIDYIALTTDGFISAGSSQDSTGDNGCLVRTDTSGMPIWINTYGGIMPDDFHRVELTTSGDFICSGTTSSAGPLQPNMWLAKISSTGTLIWSKAFGGDNHDHGYSGQQTSDGGYILAGHTGSYGYNYEEAYVVKTDGNGDVANKLVYTTVFSLLSPTSSSCGAASTPIILILRNFSNAAIANIPCSVQVTGSANQLFTQIFSASDDTVTIGNLNTTSGGTYTFTCWTNNNNDVYPARNILTVTITIPPFNAPPTVTGGQRCGNGQVNLSATAASTIYWFSAPNGGVSLANGPNYSPTISATTTYYAQTGLTCPSTRVPVVATINPIPATPTSPGASNCGPAALTLNVTSNDPVSWFTQASGGSAFTTGLSYTTPTLNSTTTYYIQASNANCTSQRVAVVALISSVAADPITSAGSRCGAGSVILNATSSDSVKWYDAASGGNLVGNGSPFITPSLSTTTTFYAQASNGCLSNRVSAVATINALAANPVVSDTGICGSGSVTINATSSNSVSWYSAATGGTQLSTGNNFTTPVLNSTTTYYVEAFNGQCPSIRIPVTVTINPLPVVSLGNDTNIVSGNYTINAGGGFSYYNWSNGSILQTLTVSITDTYCVTVTDVAGCTNSDCVFVDFSIGINEAEFTQVNLYPNPSSGIFNIELTSGEEAQMDVLTISGQVIYSNKINGIEKIDLSTFAKGIYYLSIKNEKGLINRRLIIQ